jgi:SAM-dependent methyltransferase
VVGDGWDGDDYQRRVEANTTGSPHGEADLVAHYDPASVLDAGCGTGRVAIELARRGIEVTGVDADPSMLATARRLAPRLRFEQHDLADLDLGERFDVVVMAGNVPLFTPPGTTGAVVAGCARHLAATGVLVAGFSLGGDYSIEQYDAEARAAGLALVARFATWERSPFTAASDYAVSVHAPAAGTGDDRRRGGTS